jgi:hypothetical protein
MPISPPLYPSRGGGPEGGTRDIRRSKTKPHTGLGDTTKRRRLHAASFVGGGAKVILRSAAQSFQRWYIFRTATRLMP